MPEISGLLFARGTDTNLSGVGPSSAIALVDRAGSSTTLTPANGVDYLVLAHGEVVNEADNGQWGELRFSFGSTVYARGRSSFRFTTFGGNDASGGQNAGMFFVTGNGSDQLTATMAAEAAGSSTDCTSIDIIAVPIDELEDVHTQESTNTDTIGTPPTTGFTTQATFQFTPDSTETYALIVYAEFAGDGTEVAGTDEYSARVQVDDGGGGGAVTFQQAFGMDVALGYAANETMQSCRWTIPVSCTASTQVTVTLQLDGTAGGGNIGARRMRFVAFRGPEIFSDTSSSGINANPGAAGTATLTGASVAVTDADEAILGTCFGTFEIQTGNFLYGQFNIDSGASFVPTQGFFRGISSNGVAAGNDHAPVSAQYSLEFADGAHTVGMRSTWVTAGTSTWGRNRGNTGDVPQTLVVIRWTATADTGVDGEIDASLPVPTMAFVADLQHQAELAALLPVPVASFAAGLTHFAEFAANLPLPAAALEGTVSAPVGTGSDDFEYEDDPVNQGWNWLNLVAGDPYTQRVATGGELRLECSAGGAAGSFWFQTNDGILLWREISGTQWRIECQAAVLNSAGTDEPPVTAFRIGGLQVHDPENWPASPSADDGDRTADYNYVHAGFGSFNVADNRAEWKTTADGVTSTSSVSWPTAAGYLAIERDGQSFSLEASLDGSSWTVLQVIDRSATVPMASTLRFGFMCYASEPTHNIQLRVESVTVMQAQAVLDALLPVPTAALAANTAHVGAISALLPRPDSAFAVEAAHVAGLAAVLPIVAAAFDADAAHVAAFAVTLPVPVAAFEGELEGVTTWTLDAALPIPAASLAADLAHVAILAASLPVVAAAFSGTVASEVTASLGATLPVVTAEFRQARASLRRLGMTVYDGRIWGMHVDE